MYTKTEYEVAMARVDILMELDPEEGSSEGNELIGLVDQCIEYELHHFPMPAPEVHAEDRHAHPHHQR